MRIIATAVLILLTLELTQAEPRQSKERNHNYILRRQEAGLVSGVPTIAPDHRQARDRHLPQRSDVRKRQRGRCHQALIVKRAMVAKKPMCCGS